MMKVYAQISLWLFISFMIFCIIEINIYDHPVSNLEVIIGLISIANFMIFKLICIKNRIFK